VNELQHTIKGMLYNKADLQKISILGNTAFAIEQNCKRKEQQLLELCAQEIDSKSILQRFQMNIRKK
jgi:hypothetical protein